MFIKHDTISQIYLLEVKVPITSFKGTSIWTAFIQCFKKSLGLILIFEDIPRSKIWFQFLCLKQSELTFRFVHPPAPRPPEEGHQRPEQSWSSEP